jgi:hypothetical protein
VAAFFLLSVLATAAQALSLHLLLVNALSPVRQTFFCVVVMQWQYKVAMHVRCVVGNRILQRLAKHE